MALEPSQEIVKFCVLYDRFDEERRLRCVTEQRASDGTAVNLRDVARSTWEESSLSSCL